MIERKSYTRITLALDIIRRIDSGELRGYHEMQIIKHQIDLADTIRIEPAPRMEIRCDDPRTPLDRTNICWRAAELVQKEYGVSEAVAISIDKTIPVQGGLAGGSANAAATLSMLNELWELRLERDTLAALGRRLGMDVPFYFWGATAADSEATGRIEPVRTGLRLTFLLCTPPFGVSTAEAYAGIDYARTGRDADQTRRLRTALVSGNRAEALAMMHNDFEHSVFRARPALAALRDELLARGCEAAVMSGSGSTVIGVARDDAQALAVKKSLACPAIIAHTLE